MLTLGWPEIGDQTYLLFVAWVPLWLIADLDKSYAGWKAFLDGLLAFGVWNLGCTWWIWYASAGGSIMAILGNTVLMSMVYSIAIWIRQHTDRRKGLMALVFGWMAWEYGHLHWDLTWTWLNLGNGLVNWNSAIQWYEVTGVPGGTLWILMSNVVVLNLTWRKYQKQPIKAQIPGAVLWLLIMLIPFSWSQWIYSGLEDADEWHEVVVVQPNIDPYNEKFNGMSATAQIQRILTLADREKTDSTLVVFGPETALPRPVWMHDIKGHPEVQTIEQYLGTRPGLNLIIGMSAKEYYETVEQPTPTARKLKNSPGWYENYNSALQVNADLNYPVYHKSKLVVGVEKMPFPALFKPFEKLAINLGGTVGSLGTQPERENFSIPNSKMNVAPVICFESIFGEFVGEYVRKGANCIAILTNDGWWDDTPGHRQHLLFARLRAIETRRDIARSANTGISGFINYKGEITQPTSWWVPDAVRGRLSIRNDVTWYVKYGDFLSRLAAFIAILLWIAALVNKVKQKTVETA